MNESPMARAARGYIESGIAVIPLKSCGKEPVTRRGLNDWTDNPGQVDIWWGHGETYNVGGVLGQVSGGLIALDFDVHGDVSGLSTLHEWEVEHGKLPETWTQITGSGGKQMFYRVSREIRNSANGALGVDVRGDGGYVVLPPSIHPCGEPYEWSISPEDMDVADADDNVYAFIASVRSFHRGDGVERERFSMPDVVDHDRNNTLFRYASSLRSTGRSDREVELLVRDANARCCKPPLGDHEVGKIIGSVLRYEQGNGLPRKVDTQPINPEDGLTKAAKLKDITTYEIASMLAQDESISSSIKTDELDHRAWKVGPLPWDQSEVERPITDADTDTLYGIMEYGRGIRSKSQFDIAFSQFANLPSQRFNPIKEAIEALPIVKVEFPEDDFVVECDVSFDGGETWERRPTMAGNLFVNYLGAELNEYTYEVERLMLRQIVARCTHPGCKADHMVVLTGAQGIGKSTFVSKLALRDRFYLENFSSFDEEHKRRLIGKTVVEVSELDGFDFQKMASIKALITEPVDTVRFPYEKRTVDAPRTSIFIGTTNENDFLTDTTGNRRFLPIRCGASMCQANPRLFNGEAERDVQQAVAETVAYMRHVGEDAFMNSLVLPRGILDIALAEQEEHTQEDDVFVAVSSWVGDLGPEIRRINVKMTMIEGMGYSQESFAREKRYVKNDVARALSQLEGWGLAKGKQRVERYGTSRAWERKEPITPLP